MENGHAALHDQGEKTFLELIGNVIVDHWAHEGRWRAMRIGNDQPLGKALDLREQRLVHAVANDQATRGRTALSRRHEG